MKKHPLIKRLSLTAASALALLVITAPQAEGAAFDSPVGPWDFTLSGKAQGIAQIVFNADGTIDGVVQIYTTMKLPSPSNNPRGTSDDGTRNVEATNATVITNYAGNATIDGRWSFDERGKIVGYLNEGGYVITSTTTNASTNGISFRGVVSLGTKPRVTLNGVGPVGKVTYSGIPDAPLPDLSGTYTTSGKRGSSQSVEFFTLTSAGGNNNIYAVTQGSRPGAGFDGDALLSGRKQFSMVTASVIPNQGYILTVLVGSINTNSAKASLKGRESVHKSVSMKMYPTPIPPP